MGIAERIVGKEFLDIYEKVVSQQRLSYDDGMRLAESKNLTGVGYLANIVREQKNGSRAYYVRNQHINYTNICNKGCKFCSFYAKKGGPTPYTLSLQEVRDRLNKFIEVPLTEVHMVGGINPKIPYEYYLDLLRTVKDVRPDVHIKAFTAVELVEIARVAKKPLFDTLLELKAAGLDSLPGGGIEVLSDRVHHEIFGRKLDGDEWKEVARTAAKAGLRQYATMLYGHIETLEERVNHLVQLRELQDETGHFLTMTPLCFHPEDTELDYISHPTCFTDLQNIALSRLLLDNFDHIKSFWIMNTPAVSQAALWYGADDMDGTVLEYEITYADDQQGNKSQGLSRKAMIDMITEAGRQPIERDSLYNEITSPEPTIRKKERILLPMAR